MTNSNTNHIKISIENETDTPDNQLPSEHEIINFIKDAINTEHGPYFNKDRNLTSDKDLLDSDIQIIPSESTNLISICFVDKNEMQRINKEFRKKDKPTNILSFPAVAPAGFKFESYLGDLILSPEVIEAEAITLKKDLKTYYAHMFIHGVLHLLGYDHMNDADAEVMEGIEARLLPSQEGF
jgi:probable rRNA maturation factor